jgi:hypothetical protein
VAGTRPIALQFDEMRVLNPDAMLSLDDYRLRGLNVDEVWYPCRKWIGRKLDTSRNVL